ncbi:MBL fold metallo-hydrolase [Jiulongibacter sp. NS-SX5]|uniref:MBL fold metallo-hydrolase n=1 Tax=Jiulongibacter sp. NS-SX5 TaxID=3463854 RepID=UPI004057E89D
MSTVKKFIFSPFSENTYVVYDDSDEAIIVDPGCLAQHEKEELKAFITSNGLKPKALLQTHTHLDHVFGSAYVKRNFNIKMYMHRADLPVLSDVENRCKTWGIPGYEPVEADEFLEEGEQFTFGNTTLDIIWVPGHAPGHLAFINHKEKYVLGGDCLFKGSIGRTDFPLCSHEDLMNSIRKKFFTLPDDYTIYAGHMDETTVGFEKKFNPFFK